MVTSDIASDPSDYCVGGLELTAHFGQQDDRCRIINSAKTLGWLDDNYIDEENFLDGKYLFCLISINVFSKLFRSKRSWMFNNNIN